jgi:ERCC4-related helicase
LHESFKAIFDVNQVFVLLDRKLHTHLQYGELDMSEVDYLIFDEAHNIYPESTYVSIMNKFIFNHELMQSPAKNPVLLKDKRLPKVLAFFSLDSLL